ncbi:hypothetical protein [Helicobacter sp. 23-1045]
MRKSPSLAEGARGWVLFIIARFCTRFCESQNLAQTKRNKFLRFNL